MAFRDRSDELAFETRFENRAPTSQKVAQRALCSYAESAGMEYLAGGSGEKSPNFGWFGFCEAKYRPDIQVCSYKAP